MYNIKNSLLAEYITDTSIVFIIMGAVSYEIFKVNKKAFDKRAKVEEEITQKNLKLADINRELLISRKSLEESEKKYRAFYENALVGMATVRVSDRSIIHANEIAYRLTGFQAHRDEIKELTIYNFYSNPKDREIILKELYEHGEIHGYEFQFKKRDKTNFWCALTAKIYPDEDKIEVVFVDISKRKIAEQDLHRLTYYDPLTKLANVKLFKKIIDNEINKSFRKKDYMFALMCIGIDKFKNINDIYTYSFGDKLLQEVSKRLKTIFRGDDSIARFTGARFVILLSDIGNSDGVISIIKKIYKAFMQKIEIGSQNIKISISCGVTIFPTDGDSPDKLIKNCEIAYYNAKESGQNSYNIYDEKLNKELILQAELEEELKLAIANDEMVPFFQPKYDQNKNLVGMEALVRWNSPKRGLLTPNYFIPLAEKTNLISEIDDQILYKTCQQIATWINNNLDPHRISVNTSPGQFDSKSLSDKFKNIINETGISPENLEIEIVETGIMNNEKEAVNILKTLHDMGITVSIDDFGTGYSSLSKLKDFPVDTLKIDKVFVDNLPDDIKSVKIATTIIDLAHTLDFKVVAEGVENEEQFKFLKTLNCDYFQGYYFSKPIPAHEIERILINNQYPVKNNK